MDSPPRDHHQRDESSRPNIILNHESPDDIRRGDVDPFLLQQIAHYDSVTVRICNEHPSAFRMHMFCQEGREMLRRNIIGHDLPQTPPQRKEPEIPEVAIQFITTMVRELPARLTYRLPKHRPFESVFRDYRKRCEKHPFYLPPRYGLRFGFVKTDDEEHFVELEERDSPESKNIGHMDAIRV